MVKGNFILLDAARMNEAIEEAKKLNPVHKSLYLLNEDELLQTVAPFLFSFENDSEFNNYFLEKGWGDSWGVLVNSKAGFEELHKHFRRFLQVKTDDDVELYFRFYDPRVLRIFLPTCDMKQLIEFFGPVQSFLLEDEDSRFGIKFWLENGNLKFNKIHFREIATDSVHAEKYHPPSHASAAETDDESKLVIPTRIQPEKNITTANQNIPKPNKPKWNMLD